MKKKAVDLLAITPHPIDIELGMGGTIASLIREGKEVVFVICTNGDKASSDPGITAEELALTRKREQLKSAKLLGVKEVVFLNHPDLSLVYSPEFRSEIIRLILEFRPKIVATCDPYQRYLSNPDHRVTGQVVMDAVWPCVLAPNTYRDLIREGYELHKVQEVWLWATEEPNYYRDITGTFDIKFAALKCHLSQIEDPPKADFVELVNGAAAKAAAGKNYKLGEAFHRLEVLQRL